MTRGHARADRYELVFVLLLLTFVIGSFAAAGWTRLPSLALYVAALLIAIRSAQLTGTVARALRLGLGGGSIIMGVVVVVVPGTTRRRGTAAGRWPSSSRCWDRSSSSPS